MLNTEIEKVVKYLCALYPNLDADAYYKQLYLLYGAVPLDQKTEPIVLNEIIALEQERIADAGRGIETRITDAASLVEEYSRLSFSMAQQSLKENKSFKTASLLGKVFDGLLSSGTIPASKRSDLKIIISDTGLDFSYAAGNHHLASLRMAPVIRSYKKMEENKNGII